MIPASCKMSGTSVHSSSGTLSDLILDLIDRVPDQLWTVVHDLVQETGIKIIPKKKKCKKGKWVSEEALQIAEKEEKRKAKEKRKDIPT